jgi:hypothetical protein
VPAPLPTLRSLRFVEIKSISAPVCVFGPGDRPHSSLTSVSLAIEGVGAPTRRSARIAPGGVSGLLRTMRCTCDAPRAFRRANKHLRAYALPTARTDQDLFVPGRFTRAPPVGKVASTSPAGALPLPALTNASGRRPSNLDRDRMHVGEFHYKVNQRHRRSRDGDRPRTDCAKQRAAALTRFPLLWWRRTVPSHKVVMGWTMSPSRKPAR